MLFSTLQLPLRLMTRTNILRTQSLEIIAKRNGSGWVHRRPIAVLNEEIELEDNEKRIKRVPRKHINEDFEDRKMKPKIRHQPPNKQPPKIQNDNTFNEDGTPNIIKYTDDNRKLASLIIALKSKKMRARTKQILLEGRRLINDAIKAGVVPEIIMFSRVTDLKLLALPQKGVKLYKVPYAVLQLWSDLTTTPGIIGIFKSPESFEKEPTADTLPLTIICDNVREPGNMGTILRAAAGAGCERLILTKGCVDIWEPKVLRSAAGAHFRVTILNSVEWDDIASFIEPSANIYIADNDSGYNHDEESNSSIEHIDSDSDNENTVNSKKIRAKDEIEVFTHSARDWKKKNLTEFEECPESTESNESTEYTECIEPTEASQNLQADVDERKSSGGARKVTIKELASRIPAIPYYAADYAKNNVVLIVGGETEGLSFESVQLVQEKGGVRVNVPMVNDVESLNTGMALGIVAFEIKKQFALRKASVVK